MAQENTCSVGRNQENTLTIYFRRYLNDPGPGLPGQFMWIPPVNAPNGFITGFIFGTRPIWCSLNGLNQFEGEGYNVVQQGANYIVTFIDDNGTIITPEVGADIRAEIS